MAPLNHRFLSRRLLPVGCLTAVLLLASLHVSGGLAPDERRDLLARIDSLHRARQVEPVEVLIEPLLAEARAATDSSLQMPLASKLGRLWASFGRPQQAEPLLAEAIELAGALRDTLALCDALRWYGYAVEQLGRGDEAEDAYRRILSMATARDDRYHEAWARVGLGYQAHRVGRIASAIEDYRRAADLFRELESSQAEIWALNGQGTALQASGRFDEAVATYRRVSEVARQIPYHAAEALAENNLGTVEFARGDPGVALAHFERANELQRLLDQTKDAVTSGTNIGICLLQLGRTAEAAEHLQVLLAESEAGGLRSLLPHVLIQLAAVERYRGRYRQAMVRYRAVQALEPAAVALKSRVEALIGVSDCLAALDSTAAALAVLEERTGWGEGRLSAGEQMAFDQTLGQRYLETGRPDLALLLLASVAETARSEGLLMQLLEALAWQARCLRATGRPDGALACLQEAAAVWESARERPLDAEWREQRGAAGRMIYTQLAGLLARGTDGETTPEGVREAFEVVQIFKARTLAERLSRDTRTDDRAASVTSPPSLEEFRTRVLRPDEVFLDAYMGPEESVVFLMTTTDCRVVFLPAAPDLAPRLRLLHELMARPPRTGDDGDTALEAGRQIGRSLAGGPLPDGCRRILFCPDGALNLLPAGCLAPDAEDDRITTCRVPSAAILSAQRGGNSEAGDGPAGVLALAGSRTPGGEPMPGAVSEVRRLSRRYRDVTVRVDSDPDRPLTPDDLSGHAVLHLATHARLDDQRPWSSEIVFNPDDPDGRLRAAEIGALRLDARLAVLSACETGSGRVLSGEGVLGLSSAFLGAGVPAVVASLWPVEDAATARLMDRFYRELAGGRSVATALEEARAALRADEATAHPFYWAGFVVIGDGSVDVGLEERLAVEALPRGAAAGGLALVGLVLALVLLRRRRRRA